MIGNCEDCIFWRKLGNPGNGNIGECWRYPPTRLDGYTVYPETTPKDGCGEYVAIVITSTETLVAIKNAMRA